MWQSAHTGRGYCRPPSLLTGDDRNKTKPEIQIIIISLLHKK